MGMSSGSLDSVVQVWGIKGYRSLSSKTSKVVYLKLISVGQVRLHLLFFVIEEIGKWEDVLTGRETGWKRTIIYPFISFKLITHFSFAL
jgi:hypothetical protein